MAGRGLALLWLRMEDTKVEFHASLRLGLLEMCEGEITFFLVLIFSLVCVMSLRRHLV